LSNHFKLISMEIKISTQQVLNFLHVLAWIIFIGLCIEAGGIMFNAIFTHFVNPVTAKQFWKEIDLSNLYNQDSGYFLMETALMSIIAIMKALLFYLIVKNLYDKNLNLSEPFNKELRSLILNISYLTLGIGLFSFWGINYTKWIENQDIKMPDIQYLRFSGADVWLFMSVILFVIAQIFKKGIEMQEERELTI
jgi:hypothetical protein